MTTDAQNGSPGISPGDPEALDPEVLMERVERLSAEVDRIADPAARESAQELLAAVMDLYGEGLQRILGTMEDAGEAGESIRRELSEDGVVASLMLIHDLYPVGLEERVAEALDSVRPYMESHGGDVKLLSLEHGVARLRLEGSCDGCPASASTLELAIKQALDEAAPDLAGLEVEGIAEGSPAGLRADEALSGTPLPVVHVGGNGANGSGRPGETRQRRRPGSADRLSGLGRPATGHDARRGPDGPDRRGRNQGGDRQRRRLAARVPRPLRRLRVRAHRRRAQGRGPRLSPMRAPLLPAARGPLDG